MYPTHTHDKPFPYTTRFDLTSLLNFWRSNLENNPLLSKHPVMQILDDKKLLDKIETTVQEDGDLTDYQEVTGLLLSAIFAPAMIEEDMIAVHIPFRDKHFFATKTYEQVLSSHEKEEYTGTEDDMLENCHIMAGLFILKEFYRPELVPEMPVIVNAKDKKTGLEKVYKLEVNTQFTTIEVVNELPELSDSIIEQLLNNLHDLKLWQKYLPGDNFIFKGFTVTRLTDVTSQEMLSSIKYYLLKRDAVTCGTNFSTIQEKIRSLFNMPSLRLGIVFFDPSYNIISNAGLSEWNSFLTADNKGQISCNYFEGSVYDEVFKKKQSVIIQDLANYPSKTFIEKGLLEAGIHNIGIAPLINNGEIVGMLELATPVAGKLNSMNANKLANVLPMFTAAIQRVLGDLQVEVRAIIQKECTAIHPSVEWKFIEEGYELIRNRSTGKKFEMPEIVFDNVNPLFGMSDIRNSSVFRNSSIREDLLTNLKAAEKTLDRLYEHKQMHIFNELNFRVRGEMKRIKKGLASGDESNILEFIRKEVNESLEFYGNSEKEVYPLVKEYFDLIDHEYKVVYKKRRAFEESLTKVNQTISGLIDESEKQAQEIFPHYFEKYKTDGVEYNMYVGQSLVKDKTFDPLYLHNFRLWQLVLMCQIATRIEELQPELSHPLEITQLILVQNEPLDIRFRKDEKHFDVDGAYNIRYEILKKRIDKAFIKGTSQRLTQPGTIAIVYSHEKEAAEYLKYIKYLQSINCLTNKVETLELEDVQGANGLRAVRVEVVKDMQPLQNEVKFIRESVAEALN